MQIQINTDRNIQGHEALGSRVRGAVENALTRRSDHITRVEVHLSDESNKKGGDKGGEGVLRCLMEARLERHPPIAVDHRAGTLDLAVHGALDKLTRLVEHTIRRVREHKARATTPRLETQEEVDS